MTEADLRAIVFVRAVEQTSSDLVPQTARDQAALAAGDRSDPGAWLARRARCLLDGALARFRPAVDHVELRVGTLGWILPAAFLLGLLGNYLGPTRKIHVLYNPIGLLVLWNLGVYAALLVLSLRGGRARSPARPAAAELPTRPPDVTPPVTRPRRRSGVLERALLAGLRRHVVSVQTAAWNVWSGVRTASELVRAFVTNWFAAMRPALGHAAHGTLHLGAIGIALGAVAGMYVRGLFLDYAMIWRSTFLDSPEVVAWLLRVVLAPAALLMGEALPSAADAATLMSRDGSPAAHWIHLLAVTVVLAVIVPRALLATMSAVAYRRAIGGLAPSLDDPYVLGLLEEAARLDARKVRADIRTDIAQAFVDFRVRLADFVATELHEKRIEPELDRFREDGGKLGDLEARLAALCQAFEPELRGQIGREQLELERQITARVAWRLGGAAAQQLEGDDVLACVSTVLSGGSLGAGGRAGDNVVAGVGTVVAGAVAAVTGTVSGGFGHSLGTAVLVGLVHSGPVAWVIGALGGAVVSGAVLYLGKDALRDGLKRVTLPSAVARMALLRIDRVKREGRAQCRRHVADELGRHFEEADVVGRTAEAISNRLAPMLGDRLSPPGGAAT